VASCRAVSRYFPAAIFLASLLLRFALAAQGGQYFFADEGRYERGIDIYRALASGNMSAALATAAQPEHTLFPWVGAGVVAIQHALAHLTPFGDWSHPEYVGFTIWIGAAVLSVFSALNVALIYPLARRAGADKEEAAWAMLLMAGANAALYHSRHLLPYDCALSAALAALVLGLGKPNLWRSAAAGLLTGCTYHLYNGYWFLVPLIVGLLGFVWRGERRNRFHYVAAAAGATVALLGPLAFGIWVGGERYWTVLRAFSGSVTQGIFAEGWSLPWEYLWHTEGWIGLAVVLAMGAAFWQARQRQEPLPDRVRVTLAALGAAWLLLTLLSTGLARFVVYGRTVKPLVPALCLLGAWALARLLAPRPAFKPMVALAFVFAAALHFAPHFSRVFPREIETAVLRDWGNPRRALTVTGSLYSPLALPVNRPHLALVNAQFLYPVKGPFPTPPGTTLLRFEHPLSYEPLQYEGHTPRERALLRETDISIRLIQLAMPDIVPDNPRPGQLYQFSDRPSGR
jgi:hypothetical protein